MNQFVNILLKINNKVSKGQFLVKKLIQIKKLIFPTLSPQ